MEQRGQTLLERTVVALLSQGLTDTSFVHHLESAKANGITKNEIAEIITHAAFYAGWPKAWAAFRLAKDIWKEDANEADEKTAYEKSMLFPIGQPNDAFAQYFAGQSYLAPISKEQVGIFNVTFEPGCRNNWVFNSFSCCNSLIIWMFDFSDLGYIISKLQHFI